MRIAEVLDSSEGMALGYTNSRRSSTGPAGPRPPSRSPGKALSWSGTAAEPDVRRVLRAHEARMLYHLGRWDEAERVLRDALAIGPVPKARLFLLVQVARLAAARGRFEEAEAAVAKAADLESDLGGTEYGSALLEARVELAAWSGRLDAGRAAVDEAMAIPTAGHLPTPPWPGSARSAAARGRRSRGRPAAPRSVGLAASEARAGRIVDWLRGWLPAGDLSDREAAARAMEPVRQRSWPFSGPSTDA
jgi:tetratricopeptide (TPR) repeat protein